MSDSVYDKLARLLDNLSNGFPATPDGLEIRLPKTLFAPDEAEFCPDHYESFEALGGDSVLAPAQRL